MRNRARQSTSLSLVLLILLTLAISSCRTFRPVDSRPANPRGYELTLILLSFDGWRWDYHTKAPTPNLRRLMARGTTVERLIPVFPTKTFPNHYTIVTGLYPEHHGIVANSMRDPVTGLSFSLRDRQAVEDARWWRGEPIWVTAQRQGQRAATMFWPGSEAPVGGVRPRYWKRFDAALPNQARVDQILAWLDLPASERPTFIAGYFSDTDQAGHHAGPSSAEVRAAIVALDRILGRLLDGLEARRLLDVVNVAVVSDHGMTDVRSDRRIALDAFLDLDTVDVVDVGPNLGLTPRTANVDDVYRPLANAHPHLHVFRRAETPAHWHYRDNPRIPPIVGVVDEGWQLLPSLPRTRPAQPVTFGTHGYDPAVVSMHGIFVAAGPAFPRGVQLAPFESVHLYNALTATIGLSPAPNDGDPDTAQLLLAAKRPRE
ncbi:MAG: alkaline phosphatase family protein [Luteitalea sp.]|nr:alkaline phosphatase family protein [Luteitalea sp.]